jgi:RNA polymerase sigma-70 factor (ECF subfamily)
MTDTKVDSQLEIDRHCIEAVQSGDKNAYSTIVKCYMKKAYYIALGFVKSEPDALDISQDAFIKAFKHIKKFRTGNPFFPWFYQILRNLCLDWLKKKRKRNQIPLENIDLSSGPSCSQDIKIQIWKGIEKLPLAQKEILILRYFQGFSYAEIAQTLDKPLGSVMSSIHYAKRNLRIKMENI